MKHLLLIVLLIIGTSLSAQSVLEEGVWHAEIQLNDSVNCPFMLTTKDGKMFVENAEEKIIITDIVFREDSVFARFPDYDSELRFTNLGPVLAGDFINHSRPTNNLFYFRAIKDMPYRFSVQAAAPTRDISGRWKLVFDSETGIDKVNVAVFKQQGNRVTGTVLTATGDHRFLDGELSGDRLRLSTFNGAFVMVYEGRLQSDGTLKGDFYSGRHGHDSWMALQDSSVSLPDAASITFLKPGYHSFDFNLPDQEGKRWSMKDSRFKQKVVVVQLMGTWCPNCLDETAYLSEYYAMNRMKGVEMIAIDFERVTDSVKVWNSIRRIQNRFSVDYPIVYGGSSNRDSSSAVLPMISQVNAYPTTLILDRKGEVRKIHTGFSGPAAKEEYAAYKKDFESFMNSLLQEK